MKKLLFIGGGILILTALAFAQTSPNLITGQIPSAAQWNSYFAGKADTVGGHLTNPVIDNAQMNGPTNFADPVTFSGGVTYPGALTAGSLTTSGGGSLSGTFTGNPNLSGAPIFTGTGAVVTLPAVGAAQALITGLPAGDGVTDDTTAVNTFLAARPYQTVLAPVATYRMASGNLQEAFAQTIIGSGNAGLGTQSPPSGTIFLLNPAYSVIPQGNLINLSILRDGLISNPTAAQLAAEVATWATDQSVGIFAKQGGLMGAMTFDNLFIGGFNTGIVLETGQFNLSNTFIDSWNGVAGFNIASRSVIKRVQPSYWMCYSNCDMSGGSIERDGIGFYFGGFFSSATLINDYSLGFAQGYVATDAAALSATQSGAEFNVAFTPNFDGVGGAAFRAYGTARFLVDHGITSKFMEEIDNTSTGGTKFQSMQLGAPPAVNGVDYIHMGGTSATPSNITIGGTAALGNTITVVVASASLDATQTIVYTVSPMDMAYNGTNQLKAIARHLTWLINQNLKLTKAHFWADGDDNFVSTVYWPVADTATVTATPTGSLTSAVTSGTAFGGSSAEYSSISTPSPSNTVPLFNADGILGPGNLIHDLVPFGGIWANWFLNYPNNGKVHIRNLILNSVANAPTVTGTGCSLASGGTDLYGYVNATTTASTCSVAFSVAAPIAPWCFVQTQDGAPITSMTKPTTAGFSFAFASPGATTPIRYSCSYPPD